MAFKKVGAKKKTTQAQRARAVVKQLRDIAPVLRVHLRNLDAVLGEAQNGPPNGPGDGSIEPDEWHKLWAVKERLGQLVDLAPLQVG